jgi:hypothetical protein
MKAVIASVVTALVVAGGAGAYSAVVTPRQFAALQSRVTALELKAGTLQAQVGTLQATVGTLQAATNTLQSSAGSNSTLVSCLQRNWNLLRGFPLVPAPFAINGAVFDSSTYAGAFSGYDFLNIPVAGWTKC